MKYSWEVCIFPRAFHNNSLCKIWGANRAHYGELENREWSYRSRKLPSTSYLLVIRKLNEHCSKVVSVCWRKNTRKTPVTNTAYYGLLGSWVNSKNFVPFYSVSNIDYVGLFCPIQSMTMSMGLRVIES